jgi:NAD(P)-dependent dehydrogenase (short-subunit alcohol dehydrogenase family)
MDINLAGRTAVVTGGSKGIGLAVVRRLAASGAQVITGAKSPTPEIEALTHGKQVIFAEADLGDPGGPAQLVAMAGDRVDILVNNVGGARARPGGFLSITDDDWAASLTLNLMAAVRATRAALPGMLAAGADVIVMTCSVNARLARPGRPRLQRRQGRAGWVRQSAVQGGRTARDPGQHGQPRPGRHRLVAGQRRRRRDRQPGHRGHATRRRKPGRGRVGHRPVQPARGGR